MFSKGQQSPLKVASKVISKHNSQRNSPSDNFRFTNTNKHHTQHLSGSPTRLERSIVDIPYKPYRDKETSIKRKSALDAVNKDALMKQIFSIENKFGSLPRESLTPTNKPSNFTTDFKNFNRKRTDLVHHLVKNNRDNENQLVKTSFLVSQTNLGKTSYESPQRLAKSNPKSMVHDPITGAIKEFKNERGRLSPLGYPKNEIVITKLSESPISDFKYEAPQYGKKLPRSTIFNPLTGESKQYERDGLSYINDSMKGASISTVD